MVAKSCFNLASLVLLVAAACQYAGASEPMIPFPEGVVVNVVGEDIKVSGLPMMAYEFHSSKKIEELMDFYRHRWSAEGPVEGTNVPFIEADIGEWRVLSRLEKGHNITVQFATDGVRGAIALVGISPLPEYLERGKKNIVVKRVPEVAGTNILSVVASVDKGRRSEVYWIDSRMSVEKTLGKYQRHYELAGAQTNGYKIDQKYRDDVGTLRVNGKTQRLRFDAARVGGITRVIALWQPL